MDGLQKLSLAAEQTLFEGREDEADRLTKSSPAACGYTPAEIRRRFGKGQRSHQVQVGSRAIPIFMAAAPGGRRVPLVKAMLTTACERDCNYCPFRAGRDAHRVTFKPDELARLFDAIHRAGRADGLFLSTGIFAGGANTQNKLLDTAEVLRLKLGYRGYLHLKIMPGAEKGQVLRSMQLADRVSINLEAPNQARLARLAPNKHFEVELLAPLRWVEEIRRSLPPQQGWAGRWPSSTTQFVVGAAGESDLDLLSTVGRLTRSLGLARAYFEAFHPVPGTPLENHPAEDPLRQHRLYQASFLLRDYGFDLEDFPFSQDGRLPLERDPKLAYAMAELSENPVEMNQADQRELLRVPGIGPRSARAILRARRTGGITGLGDLTTLGVVAERAAPYILIAGRRPIRQMRLF